MVDGYGTTDTQAIARRMSNFSLDYTLIILLRIHLSFVRIIDPQKNSRRVQYRTMLVITCCDLRQNATTRLA